MGKPIDQDKRIYLCNILYSHHQFLEQAVLNTQVDSQIQSWMFDVKL